MSMMELLSQMRESQGEKGKEEKPAMVLYHHFG